MDVVQDGLGELRRWRTPTTALLLLYYCFTTALLLLYYCFTTEGGAHRLFKCVWTSIITPTARARIARHLRKIEVSAVFEFLIFFLVLLWWCVQVPHRLFKDFSSGGALLVILEQTLAYMKDKRMRSLEELQTQVAVFVLLYSYSQYVFVRLY